MELALQSSDSESYNSIFTRAYILLKEEASDNLNSSLWFMALRLSNKQEQCSVDPLVFLSKTLSPTSFFSMIQKNAGDFLKFSKVLCK